MTENRIVLRRGRRLWLAKFIGPHATEVVRLFKTAEIETAFSVEMKAGDAALAIARRNRGCTIGIEAREFGTTTMSLCHAQTGGSVVWMNDDWHARAAA
jgi:hypothetical protein